MPPRSSPNSGRPQWGKRVFYGGALCLLLIWLRLYTRKPEVPLSSTHVVVEDKAAKAERAGAATEVQQEQAPAKTPVEQFVATTLKENRVVVFSKSYCGFSRMAKEAMARNLPAEAYLVVELDRREDGPQIQEVLRGITGGSTVPRVFVDGVFLGGGTDTAEMDRTGKLGEMLQSKGIKS